VSDVEASLEVARETPFLIIANLTAVALFVVGVGWYLGRGPKTSGVPDDRQNAAEYVLDFFVSRARGMGDRRVVRVVAAFLATCFLLILVSNAVAVIPLPGMNYPPTAFFGVTLGLALCAVIGSLVLSGVFNGMGHTIKHLFWPNPLQIISEITDVLSLSLRLFGNIAGEYMTLVLVTSVIAIGIPLILHVLGLIPTFVQALVFTLLTASFIANALAHAEAPADTEEPATQGVAVEAEVQAGPETAANEEDVGSITPVPTRTTGVAAS
jgi:F-type H+-transporting ATPase subunit a